LEDSFKLKKSEESLIKNTYLKPEVMMIKIDVRARGSADEYCPKPGVFLNTPEKVQVGFA